MLSSVVPNASSETQTVPLCVAHLVRPAQGGMRSQVRTLLTHFPHGLLAAPRTVCDFCAEAAEGNCHLLPNTRNPVSLLLAGAKVGVWAKKRDAQILHGHGLLWLPLFASAQVASGLPLVVTLHNLVPNKISAAQNQILQAAFARTSRIICVSEAVAESAKNLTGRDKIAVVRNGIDTVRFSRPLPNRADVRTAALDVPPNGLLVFCAARLSPEKGLPILLEAANALRGDFPHLRVLVAGDGPQKSELEQAAQALEMRQMVSFVGQKSADEIAGLMQAADIYVQPSLGEGLGLGAVEAMASGLPVIASRVGGLPEVVLHGETGLLVPPSDAPALADALRLLTNANRRAEMGSAGRVRAQTHFDTARMVGETRVVYQSVLANQGRMGV